MPKYPPELINTIKTTVPIADVVARYVRLNPAGERFVGRCPFHDDHDPSLVVYPRTNSFHCFGCGANGDVISFVRKIENVDFDSAVKRLAADYNIPLPENTRRAKDPVSRILNVNSAAAKLYASALSFDRSPRAMKYLRERGISDETIAKFGIGYASKDRRAFFRSMYKRYVSKGDMEAAGLIVILQNGNPNMTFYDRIMIPIRDERGRIAGFGGRALGGASPKYLNTRETEVFRKSEILFGFHLAKNSARDDLILCEGYFDVMTLHQHGYDNAVAPLGTGLTVEQIALIKKCGKSVTLCYDSDGAGAAATERAAQMLKSAGVPFRIMSLGKYKDPDEALRSDPEYFSAAYANAKEPVRYSLDRILEKLPPSADCESTIRCARECAKIIAQAGSAAEREIYTRLAAEKLNVTPAAIAELVGEYRKNMRTNDNEGENQ